MKKFFAMLMLMSACTCMFGKQTGYSEPDHFWYVYASDEPELKNNSEWCNIQSLMRSGDYVNALHYIDLYKEAHSVSELVLYTEYVANSKIGNFEDARMCILEELDRNKDNTDAANELCLICYKTGKELFAEEEYVAAIGEFSYARDSCYNDEIYILSNRMAMKCYDKLHKYKEELSLCMNDEEHVYVLENYAAYLMSNDRYSECYDLLDTELNNYESETLCSDYIKSAIKCNYDMADFLDYAYTKYDGNAFFASEYASLSEKCAVELLQHKYYREALDEINNAIGAEYTDTRADLRTKILKHLGKEYAIFVK